MIDGWARRGIDPALDAIAKVLVAGGVRANTVTVVACLVGLSAAVLIAKGWYLVALALILASRLGDGLDGAVARRTRKTDFGGYLDIVLDFVFYGAVPIGFAIADPTANALPAAALVFSFYVNGSSFLAYAILAERRKLTTTARGEKSLFFTTGLAEAGETLIVFVLACLVPAWFPALAWAFAALTLYTALSRVVLASRTFGCEDAR